MPAMATTDLDPQGTKSQVNFVVNHNQIPRLNTEGLTSRSNTCATAIHECLRQQDRHLFANDSSHAIKALITFTFQRDAGSVCQTAGNDKTYIMASFGIFNTWVAQPDDQFQRVLPILRQRPLQ